MGDLRVIACDQLRKQLSQIRFDLGLVLRGRWNDLGKLDLSVMVDSVAMENQASRCFGSRDTLTCTYFIWDSRSRWHGEGLEDRKSFLKCKNGFDRTG
jgi:hypothetical protein